MKKETAFKKFPPPEYLLIIYLCFAFALYATGQVTVSSKPGWVKAIQPETRDIIDKTGGFQYLLLDQQVHIPDQTYYSNQIYKVLNASGVQSMSTVAPSFDPEYQQLTFHVLTIARDEQIINKLDAGNIQIYQREPNLERNLYDGSVTAVINLTDVRVGDEIEISYSIKGFNPLNQGHYSELFYLQQHVPVNTIAVRVISDSDRYLTYKAFNDAPGASISEAGQFREYAWKTNGLDYIIYDPNTPAWYNPYQFVQLTTFKSWGEVVQWAMPLYHLDERDMEGVSLQSDTQNTREENILKNIRWVQDEVRYLGFLSGIGAYKPNDPGTVYKNRYGDCKDKSILLIAMLRKAGLQAWPMYVSSHDQHKTNDYLPGHNVFNHCVVCLEYYGRNIFIDPTISDQGGNLQNISFPDYLYGLIIKEGENHLTDIPVGHLPQLHINETFTMDSVGGEVHMQVISEYYNSQADEQRRLFNQNALQNIQQEFLNYYSQAYPEIESLGKIQVNDELRNSKNIFTIEENYKLSNAWLPWDESETLYFEFYPLVTESRLTYPKSPGRTMPYHLGESQAFSETARLVMPEDWPIATTERDYAGDGFTYRETASADGNVINIAYEYEITKNHIGAESADQFLKTHEEILDDLYYYMTFNPEATGFKLSWATLLLGLVILAGSIILAVFLNRKYDPRPAEPDTNRPLGGWLILPLLGAIISPILLTYYFVESDFFNYNSWLGAFESHGDASTMLTFYYLGQLLIQLGFIVFSVLVLIQFIKRRSSLPLLYILMLVFSFLTTLGEYLLYDPLSEYLIYDSSGTEMANMAGRTFFALVIWAPYFSISKRVKTTFTRRYKKSEIPEENRQVLAAVKTV